MEKIILASASPRRRELLERAGIKFTVLVSGGEENITEILPSEAVKELSAVKAYAAASAVEEAEEGTLVIGADTVVALEKRILGKPSDEKDAVQTLLLLQGRTHQVYTGVTVLEKKEGKWSQHTFCECTDVTFYPVTEEEIRRYVKTGEPMDKAGSYGIQGGFGIYVKEIHGDYNNVVGLPISRMIYEMKKLEIDMRGYEYD